MSLAGPNGRGGVLPRGGATAAPRGDLRVLDASLPLKLRAIRRVHGGEPCAHVAADLGVDPRAVAAWWDEVFQAGLSHLAATDGGAVVDLADHGGEGAGDARVATLAERRAHIRRGDDAAVRRQHRKGKLTARERIDLLLDDGTFVELAMHAEHRSTRFGLESRRQPTDGVVTGWGRVDGRVVFVYAQDFTILGGTCGPVHARKIADVLDLAVRSGAPVIGLNDGGGARIQEGVSSLDGYGAIFRRNVEASGVVPQVSVILGPCAGGAAYSPALTDFVFMVDGPASMFLTGPDIVRSATGEDVGMDELGGAGVHARSSGVASFIAPDEETCLDDVVDLLSFLPSNNLEEPPYRPPRDDPRRDCDRLAEAVPADPGQGYDMLAVVEDVVDDGEFLEVHRSWARNVVVALARLDGHVVGVVANQPRFLAGALDIHAAEKAARFVRMCDAFNIPLLTLVDVPGFLPGTAQEHGGIIRSGAKLLHAYAEATVPRVQVILRKAYGGAYIVMDSKAIGADLAFAWPANEVAVMGAEGGVDIIFRKEIAAADDPGRRRDELVRAYRAELRDPYDVARNGYVDDLIEPAETRRVVVDALAVLRAKRRPSPPRKHGNIPL